MHSSFWQVRFKCMWSQSSAPLPCCNPSIFNNTIYQMCCRVGQHSQYSDLLWAGHPGSYPCGGDLFCTHPDEPSDTSSLLYNGYWVFAGAKAAGAWHWSPIPIYHWGSRKSRKTLLLPLWAFMACSRVNITITFTFTKCAEKSTVHHHRQSQIPSCMFH